MIFNLRNKPHDLQLICIKNGKGSGFKADGQIPVNEFADNPGFQPCEQVLLSAAYGSTVVVEGLSITLLH